MRRISAAISMMKPPMELTTSKHIWCVMGKTLIVVRRMVAPNQVPHSLLGEYPFAHEGTMKKTIIYFIYFQRREATVILSSFVPWYCLFARFVSKEK
mmetsp:Transcript_24912/g.40768  ORF Transcript_24912/g.40768 Transcript_24912/m.40768 type:complete len:97 (-) Transcript_24912:105-395(-)